MDKTTSRIGGNHFHNSLTRKHIIIIMNLIYRLVILRTVCNFSGHNKILRAFALKFINKNIFKI